MKEEEFKKKVYALLEWETSWKAELHDQREQLEAYLKREEECAQMEIEQHQIRIRPAETQLLESEAQIKAEQLSLKHEHESRLLAESKAAAAQSQLEDETSEVDHYLQELRALHATNIDNTVLERGRSEARLLHQEEQIHSHFKG